MDKKNVIRISYLKLAIATIIVSTLSASLAYSLKTITEHFEELVMAQAEQRSLLFIILPSIGITLIYFLRKHLFKGRKNQGIREIYSTLQNRRDKLPTFKIPSHYFNGFLTVIFGGSTGIEVSTVVATATVGAVAQKKTTIANSFRTELVCAGVTAGIATLFGSPIAGLFFSIEVIAKKLNKTILITCILSALLSFVFIFFWTDEKLFHFIITRWNNYAIPYFILLGILAGGVATYFTKTVILTKAAFNKIDIPFIRVNAGALLVGILLFFFPQLYGDSYHAIPSLLHEIAQQNLSLNIVLVLMAVIVLKPLAAALTLGAGGDGGVFAPGIVVGSVLGMFVAVLSNHFFDTHLIVLNFALVGAAAVLSAAIHAPFTSIFLICSIAHGGFILFAPVAIGSFVARYIAKLLYPYTVYSYQSAKQE
ncbi:MAG: chloride channel protein [Flavipsychrobacter sp.]